MLREELREEVDLLFEPERFGDGPPEYPHPRLKTDHRFRFHLHGFTFVGRFFGSPIH